MPRRHNTPRLIAQSKAQPQRSFSLESSGSSGYAGGLRFDRWEMSDRSKVVKKVFASNDRAAIGIVRDLLNEQGIESRVFNEATSAVLGDIPFFHTMPEVWVLREEHVAAAKTIVQSFESGEALDNRNGPDWVCDTCGETIEGQFTSCWRCTGTDPREEEDATCENCGYLLRGLPQRRCPECGQEI